jgi:SAM-dependent methyltransferase
MPPYEMRVLVGPANEAAFDHPSGELVFPYLDESAYECVFDFGCGCGRVARQLLQQRVRPRRYVGIDLHRGMIQWCNENLAPLAPEFEFRHHDVYNYSSDRSRPDVSVTSRLSRPNTTPSMPATWIRARLSCSIMVGVVSGESSRARRVCRDFAHNPWLSVDRAPGARGGGLA